MRAIGSFTWLFLGGMVMGFAWWVAGPVAYLSIAGTPWGKARLVIGRFTFLPFAKDTGGREEFRRPNGTVQAGKRNEDTSCIP
jgi:uncharacterized membrane protein YccF (DUF307 family)